MKTKNIFLLLIISVFVLSCQGTKGSIKIEQTSNAFPIKLRFNKDTKKLRYLFLPIRVNINNRHSSNRKLETINYQYGTNKKGSSVALYKEENRKLKNTGDETIPIAKKESINLIISTAHYIEQTQWIQDSLQSYLARLVVSNENIIEIGSLKDFKTKHPKIIEELTKNDSIKFNFDSTKDQGWEVLIIPAKF